MKFTISVRVMQE